MNLHWQDDDYKGISSGLHGQLVFDTREEAYAKAYDVRLDLVEERDPTVEKSATDAAMKATQEELYKGEYIPGPTQWVTVALSAN